MLRCFCITPYPRPSFSGLSPTWIPTRSESVNHRDLGALAEADDDLCRERADGDGVARRGFPVELDGLFGDLAVGLGAAGGKAEMHEELRQANLLGLGPCDFSQRDLDLIKIL